MFQKILVAAALLCACVLPAVAQEYNPWLDQRPASHERPMRVGAASDLLREAMRWNGSRKMTGLAGPWCRDFVNLVVRRAGRRLANHSRRAIDALHLGARVSTPAPGDLVVMRHHVTFFVRKDGGRVYGFGGNQKRRVKLSTYSARQVLAYVRL